MKRYDLANLDLHPSATCDLERWVGPFKIIFLSGYASKWAAMRHNSPAQLLVTARAFTEDPGEARMALPPLEDETPEPAIWDLLLILSYLTGRRVMLPEQKGRYPLGRNMYELTTSEETFAAAQTAWGCRAKFGPEGRLPTLWLYLQAIATREAEVRGASACVALENVVRDVAGDAAQAHAPQALRDEIGKLIGAFDGITDIERDRFKSGVQYWGQPGLGTLVRDYVAHYGLADLPDGSIAKKRANHVAEIRNGLLHTGHIRSPKWIKNDDEGLRRAWQRGAAIFYTVQLIPALVQIHLDHLFGIEGFHGPRRTVELVREYFEHGTWDGDAVEAGALLP